MCTEWTCNLHSDKFFVLPTRIIDYDTKKRVRTRCWWGGINRWTTTLHSAEESNIWWQMSCACVRSCWPLIGRGNKSAVLFYTNDWTTSRLSITDISIVLEVVSVGISGWLYHEISISHLEWSRIVLANITSSVSIEYRHSHQPWMYKISRTLDLISQSLEGVFGDWKFCRKGMRLSISYDCTYCADDVNKIQAPKNMQCLSVTSFWTISNLISMKNSATMKFFFLIFEFSV